MIAILIWLPPKAIKTMVGNSQSGDSARINVYGKTQVKMTSAPHITSRASDGQGGPGLLGMSFVIVHSETTCWEVLRYSVACK
ncbi:hypothetical protein E2C01_034706 [Portunus trituberculatus]|uniref:Uncharacterized protein n=1 Tax=Portunus trituberculatus TaxID=210409 RepID=A0A5B7F1A0_PORTR|nr:hypothetical protein [Portunus trituberculatus]